ncbi:uncharacterized protein LOC112567966 [Pomacea canaliculata]|uniref:uncharacterized protein LOC112567966 n=1 Tax=Pomacea canaliculata TaxID=400727 RepID=UPI000D73CDEF|nr:uncharacterized protein LOC112567966 [Pomacea canaliculata]
MAWSKMGLCVINALVLMMTFIPRGGLAEIQLSPSDVVLDGGASGRQVVISCRLPSSQTASVSLIRITRNTTSPPLTEQSLAVANVLSTTNQGKAVLSSGGLTAATATVTGSTAEKSVTLTMTQANCQDKWPGGATVSAVSACHQYSEGWLP